MKRVKPEDIISPPEMGTFLCAMGVGITLLVSHITYWFDSTDFPHDPIYRVVFGLVWSLPTIAGVAYVRAILRTRDTDVSIFAKMTSLTVIAFSPLIIGVFKYLPNERLITAISDTCILYIPSVQDIMCLVILFAMLAELYFTVRTYMRDKAIHKN